MKILIATSSTGWGIIPEMMEEFEKRGQHSEVFDINDLGPIGIAAKLAFRVPRLRYLASIELLKRRLACFPADFDAVNIHYADPIYGDFARALKRRGKKLVTSIWGSDFLRAGPAALRNLGRTFDASDIVTSNNPEVLQKLLAYFPGISSRARVVPFGLRSLDVIAELQLSESQEETRKKLAIPSGKVVVTCGYNAIKEQCHVKMIRSLAALPPSVKSRFFALIPMTYPDDWVYREEVRKSLELAAVEYRILDRVTSIQDMCRVRIASDYAVNIQTTDSLSASIQEHMFVGSSMIVGKWLPYSVFQKMGVPLHRVESAEEITAALEKAAGELPLGRCRPAYADKIYDYSSWSSNADRWLDLYGENKPDARTVGYRSSIAL
jgi:hypothetical protein